MKAWHWAALGLGAIVLIVVIERMTKPQTGLVSTSNSGFGALGSFLGAAFAKVSAPSGNPGFQGPGVPIPPGGVGTSGYNATGADAANYEFGSATGSQYSAAMASTAGTASMNAGSGGTTFNGGLGGTGSDPFGIGSLSNPGFSTGPMGVDFTS